ncbi:phenylacetate--CoA ligase family protein [Rhodohalobacter sp. 614A]|uniref:phenylacetate--CoA ligase family protein n=1 Tax=Rhodohalobacter sp. 614A TaxID=2908649 RepID=UPI001F4803E2|nr:hypothetical protein [Rhodohalobacter sp. 614A]
MPDSFIENIYYKLPYSLQNIAVSLYGLKLKKDRYSARFSDHLEFLKESEWKSREQIETYQNEKITQLIHHAYHIVPFYKKWYDEHGVNISQIKTVDDLQKLPVLTKEMVKKNQEELISNKFEKASLKKQLTSGTTGTPLTIYQTKESLNLQWAVFWRFRERFGVKYNDRQLMFGARLPISQNQQNPPYWRHDYFNNRVYLSTSHISQKTVHDIVDYLNSTYFVFFTGYPSAMVNLANLMRENDLKLLNPPKIIFSASDALLKNHKTIIRDVFGAPVTEFYGNVEFAGTMSKCKHGRFHVDYEHCHIESQKLDDSENQELILTSWGNEAMPFIRYRIGDYGIPLHSECECGRKSDTFSGIDGRTEDYVVTPDGRKLIGMNQVFEYAENALEIQLFQKEKEEIIFRIVPGKNFGEKDKESLIREFRRRAGDEMTIRFDLVDSIEKSSSGKFRAVISEIDDSQV